MKSFSSFLRGEGEISVSAAWPREILGRDERLMGVN